MEIQNPEQIKEYLTNMAQKHPNHVTSCIKKGDIIDKSWGLSYEIDSPSTAAEIYNNTGLEKGGVPYWDIHNKLNPSKEDVQRLFGKSKRINFSEVFNAGIGECLEKAVLVQLCAQEGRDSFLINGYFIDKNDEALSLDAHAYNIVFKEGKPYLIDSQNPIMDKKGKLQSFIAPIIGIDIKESEFILNPEFGADRGYVIC